MAGVRPLWVVDQAYFPMAPKRIGHYEVLGKIGQGAMGVVYRAVDRSLNRFVALKLLSDDLRGDRDRVARFLREGRAAAALNHANIAAIYELGETELEEDEPASPYLAMEFVPGKDLHELFSQHRAPVAKVVEIAIQVSQGLEAAHSAGVVHRDLKPSNIRLTPDGQIKILDFGLARILDDSMVATGVEPPGENFETRRGVIMGTPPFMAPEVLEGETATACSDLYSFGVVLYWLLAGRLPFSGGFVEILRRVSTETAPPLSEIAGDVPEELARIVTKLLEIDPKRRYETAREVYVDLRSGLTGTEVILPSEAPTAVVPAQRSTSTRLWIGSGLAGFVAILLLIWVGGFFPPAAPSRSSTHIAILELENLTGKPEQAYLAKGISSFLINQLSEIPEIDVVSQSHAWAYASGPQGLQTLIDETGIDGYVEGYIQADEDGFRVFIALADAVDGSILSSFNFKGTADALFDLQGRIVQAISRELSVTVSAQSLERLSHELPASSTAFLRFLEGLSLLSSGSSSADAARAESLFLRVLIEAPDFPYAHWGLSRALLLGYNFEQAPDLLQKAEDAAKTALRLDPDLNRARLTVAEIYRESGRLEQAIEELETLASGDLLSSTLFEELAITYDEIGDLERSDETILAALARRSDSEVYRGLATIYASAGDDEKALEFFEKAIEADDELWLNFNDLGVYYLDLGDYETARAQFEKALELAPAEQLPRKNLGRLELLHFRLAEAIATYETIPGAELDAMTASNLGTAHFYLDAPGSLDEAEDYYLLATRLRPRDFQLQANLGDLYLRQGRPDLARLRYGEALRLVEEQLEMLPDRVLLRLSQPIYLAKLDRCANAVPLAEELDRSLARTQGNLRRIAQTFAVCGEADLAIDVIEQAIPLGLSIEFIRNEDEFQGLLENPRFLALQQC